MKKILMLATVLGLLVSGCSNVSWHGKFQNGYFDKDGKRAGYSGEMICLKQAKKETGNSWLRYCENDPKCTELMETCMKEKYTEAKAFETTKDRMEIYRKAYEEGWIKPGMTRLEVINLLGAPQIITVQMIPPRKIWMYCRSAAKTALIGYNWVFKISWVGDGVEYRVESAERVFKM